MVRFVALMLALAACNGATQDLDGSDAARARVIEEDTPEAFGVLNFLNDAGTDVTLLDIDAALDVRAARNLIARRDGPDARFGTSDDQPFMTIAEVDDVAYVGDAALRRLLDYAQANGWIHGDDPYYGTVKGVVFTVPQAEHTLWIANASSQPFLDDDVALDRRAAANIVALRLFSTVEELATVPYVGQSALRKLRDFDGEPDTHGAIIASTSTALDVIESVGAGLWFTSETDAHLDPFYLAGAGEQPVTRTNAATVLAAAHDPQYAPLGTLLTEQHTIAQTLDRYTVPQAWWDPEQYDTLDQWRALRTLFEHDLRDAKVFRFGEPSWNSEYATGLIQVFIIGTSAEGDLVGVRTVSVET